MNYLEHYFERVPSKERNLAATAFLSSIDYLKQDNPQVADAILQELRDQRSFLKLVASENFSSLATQLAMGNLLTDKYAEGFPGHRFYAGCENVDSVEEQAQDLAKNLFGAEHAYVQPHSGVDANLVAYWAVLVHKIQSKEVQALGKKSLDELSLEEYESIRKLMVNQKIMGLSLNSGGHLTHGFRHNISSKMMQAVHYDVNKETGLIDYKALADQVRREKPLILVAGYSAYPRLINFANMKEIAESVGAILIVDMAHFSGLVAGKVMTGEYNPVPYADLVTSTTHKTLRGPRGGIVLCKREYKEVVDKGCPLVLGGPLPHVIAAKAVAFKEASTQEFINYSHQIVTNAKAMAERLKYHGVPITTGGTDNHLLVMDVFSKFNLTGRQAENALREARFTLNRNAIPFDQNGAWFTSGIRVGTPALTTLGMQEEQMYQLADMIYEVLSATTAGVDEKTGSRSRSKVHVDAKVLQGVQEKALALLRRFPLYPEILID
ncbi:MAG: glycine hydroxymethyltransferase [Chlamydiae bacterium]|nr:glycine hydroxymethyltransferase [Chlamydiota bacterium]